MILCIVLFVDCLTNLHSLVSPAYGLSRCADLSLVPNQESNTSPNQGLTKLTNKIT